MKKIKISKSSILYISLFAVSFIAVFLIMRNIPLFGDDYHYAIFKNGDFWGMHKEHYMRDNGRIIVHLLATYFLSIPHIFWQILNSAFLALIATLTAKQFFKGRGRYVACISAFAMLLALDLNIVRESVYWITGSFNYVYPFALLVVFWYMLCTCKGDKFSVSLLYILAFLSSATTEQNGMMTLGLTVLYLADIIFIKKEKPQKKYIFLILPALAGLLSVYLAPATFVRYGLETEDGMFDVMKKHLPYLYYKFIADKYMAPFMMFTLASIGLYLFKTGRSIITKIISLSNVFLIVFVFWLTKIPYVEGDNKIFAVLLIFTVIFSLNSVLVFIKLIQNKPHGYFVICSAFVLAVGSQFMMSVSPVLGPRVMLCGIFNITIFATGLIFNICDDKKYFVIALGVSLLFLGWGLKIYENTYVGYKENFPVTAQNEALIDEYKKNQGGDLIQYKVPNPDHCWSMPYASPYHFGCFKIYYDLPDDVQVSWLEYDTVK